MNNTNEFNQFIDLESWISFFGTHQKLPKNKITCSVCKTNTTSMLKESNLKRSLPKFGNDVRRLLTEFACRDCRNMAKGNTTKTSITTEDNATENVRAKKGTKMVVETPEEREERIEEIRKNLPKIDLTGPKMSYDLNNPEHLKMVTTNNCWRPDLYLNGGKYCDKCELFNGCNSTLKRLRK